MVIDRGASAADTWECPGLRERPDPGAWVSMTIASNGTTDAASRLTELYEAHSAAMFRFALHLTGRREDAEDVVQYVFTQAYRLLSNGGTMVFPRAWLMRATRNRSLNLGRQDATVSTDALELELPAEAGPELTEREELAQVRATLWALPEPQHQAFVLRHWSGLSQAEIADVLETTPTAVESLLTRARNALLDARESLDPGCAEARRRLVNAIGLTGAQRAHLDSCRRCRAAQQRLARTAGFAGSWALVPSPGVAHALRSAIPGFAPHTTAAAGGAAGAGTTAGAGGAAGGAVAGAGTASQVATAAKLGLAAKVALAAVTATAAVAAVPPVTHSVAAATRDATTALMRASKHPRSPAHAAPAPASAPNTAGEAAASPADVPAAPPAGQGKAYGKDHGTGRPAGAPGHGRGAAKRAAASAPRAHGRQAAHGANGNGQAKPKVHGHTPRGTGATKGSAAAGTDAPPATGNGNGNGKAGGASNGNANGAGAGNGNAGGNGNGKGHAVS
jgi:RNA polymerase sigma factor (sigma-70 family)